MTTEKTLPEVGRRLCAARLQRGLSQGTVARRAGIAASYLSRIENGRIQPTFRNVLRILRALRADLYEIASESPTTQDDRRTCPVSKPGRCLLDLIRPESAVWRDRTGQFYSPREIRLLRRLAHWMKSATPDRLRAMEILLADLAESAESGKPDH